MLTVKETNMLGDLHSMAFRAQLELNELNLGEKDAKWYTRWTEVQTHKLNIEAFIGDLTKRMNREYYTNIDKAPISVKHSDLKNTGESYYRKHCPVCFIGTLLVYRDQKTLQLKKNDRCIVCGQEVIYSDIEEMRANDFVK